MAKSFSNHCYDWRGRTVSLQPSPTEILKADHRRSRQPDRTKLARVPPLPENRNAPAKVLSTRQFPCGVGFRFQPRLHPTPVTSVAAPPATRILRAASSG